MWLKAAELIPMQIPDSKHGCGWWGLTTANTNIPINYSSKLHLPQSLPAPFFQPGRISAQIPPSTLWTRQQHLHFALKGQTTSFVHSCGQVQEAPKECRHIWPVKYVKQSRWILLASALDVAWVVNASLERRKIVRGTKEVLQRADQEAAKLQRKIWQACLLLFKLTTKKVPGAGKIWSSSSMHMCCARRNKNVTFQKHNIRVCVPKAHIYRHT